MLEKVLRAFAHAMPAPEGAARVAGNFQRGERGVPEIPTCMMIEGSWIEGASVRPE